jgi:hypothetical protein
MGWSIGFDTRWQRDIGYGVPAMCDSPHCCKEIDRGLAYVCGGEPYGGDRGCGLYFCAAHHGWRFSLCTRCHNRRPPYKPKPDLQSWVNFKMTDESWKAWRDEQASARPT